MSFGKMTFMAWWFCLSAMPHLLADSDTLDFGQAVRDKNFEALQKVPGVQLTEEIKKNRILQASLQKQLTALAQQNLALCNQLYSNSPSNSNHCIARTPLSPNQNSLQTTCYSLINDGSSEGSQPPPPVAPIITAAIEGAPKEASFILVANDTYFSAPFSQAKNTIVFTRADGNQNVESPMFMELSKLKIVAVQPKATVDRSGIITPRAALPKGVKVRILIDGKPLFLVSNLQPPRDPSNLSEALLNPRELLGLRFAPECEISREDIQATTGAGI